MNDIFAGLKNLINKLGLDIVRYDPCPIIPKDFDAGIAEIFKKVSPYTQTSPERIFALCQAVQYITKYEVLGDIVECGVWRGGSMMAIAYTLLSLQTQHRDLYLFDTYEGMTDPSQRDLAITGDFAADLLDNAQRDDQESVWCYAPLEQVKQSVYSCGYSPEKTHFIKGKVEDTLPDSAPRSISLLRLDTDWYESTKHELIHLFPRISPGGVIIIDDYGHWQGARQAVDEYFESNNVQILLNRIDYTGRIGVVQ